MATSIFQQHPDLGTREFKLVGDAIEYRISNQFGNEELTVVLSVLSPEPVIDGSLMYFISEVNREALIKLFVDLPDAGTFSKFVTMLQQRIREESFGNLHASNRESEITTEQIDTTIHMLETHLGPRGIENLLKALHELSEKPGNRDSLNCVIDAFNQLGVQQGAVLTYAPFFNTLLSSTDLDEFS